MLSATSSIQLDRIVRPQKRELWWWTTPSQIPTFNLQADLFEQALLAQLIAPRERRRRSATKTDRQEQQRFHNGYDLRGRGDFEKEHKCEIDACL